MSHLTIDGGALALKDTNGNEILAFLETASAVNHHRLVNAATGTPPRLEAGGDDANVDLALRPKGTGGVVIQDGNGNEVARAAAGVASAVNYIQWTNAATLNAPRLGAAGDDADIGLSLRPKGAGVLVLEDGNGNEVLRCAAAVTNAANYVEVVAAISGGRPTLRAAGDDTNIPLALDGKGTGGLALGSASGTLGFFGVTLVARPAATDDIKDALTALGLLQGTSATPLNLDGGKLTCGEVNPTGALNHDGSTVGLFGVTPATRPGATDDIKDGLTTLGILQGTSASPLNLDGGKLTCGEAEIDGDLNHDGANVGFYGVAPVARPTAYTQTFSGTTRVFAAYTADDESTPYTGIDNAQVGTVYARHTDLNALRAAYETLRAHAENQGQVLNQLIDDLQAVGLLQ